MKIHCCECGNDVDARLTDGREIYPHRLDLFSLPFWKCDKCKNFVGCHHKTKYRTKPLGCIPTPEIKNARKQIHSLLDPLSSGLNPARRRSSLVSRTDVRRLTVAIGGSIFGLTYGRVMVESNS